MKNYQSISINNEDAVILDNENNNNNGFLLSKNNNNNHTNTKNDHPEDHLAPPFDSNEQRPSNLFVGTFNLIATIVGGAVLSLPIVFHKCGVAFTTCAMILSAYMTYMSLIMLCYCSRRGGGSSYGEVVRSAFGEKMEEGVSWLLFVFLMFVITSYMVLIRDIWTPLVRMVFRSDVDGDFVLLVIVGLLLPFLFQRSLHALRWNCYIGFASILVLCIGLCRGGWQRITISSSSNYDGENENEYDSGSISSSFFTTDIEIFKMPTLKELLFSFPIVNLAFLCHFNIISIQNALRKPTRERTQAMIKKATVATFVLMYMFGLGGYLYAGSRTEGNILLNVPMAREAGEDEGEYYLFLLGRIGCGTTIMLAMPLIALPCREALLEVIDVWFHHSHHVPGGEETTANVEVVPTSSMASGNESKEKFCWKLFHRCNKSETVRDATITTEDEVTEILVPEGGGRERGNSITSHHQSTILIRNDPIQSDYVFRNPLAHYGSTLLIATTCYLSAVAVSGVAVVWSFIGSSMAFFIAFILPCGCFIVIENAVPTVAEGGDRQSGWIRIAWAILCFSIVVATICTINSTVGFGF